MVAKAGFGTHLVESRGFEPETAGYISGTSPLFFIFRFRKNEQYEVGEMMFCINAQIVVIRANKNQWRLDWPERS